MTKLVHTIFVCSPLIDPKNRACVVLATSCKSVLRERAQRAEKQNG